MAVSCNEEFLNFWYVVMSIRQFRPNGPQEAFRHYDFDIQQHNKSAKRVTERLRLTCIHKISIASMSFSRWVANTKDLPVIRIGGHSVME